MIKRWTGLSLILACLILTACGGSGGGSHPGNNGGTPPTNPDDGGDDNGPPPGTINVSPKADAGRDQNVKVGDTVTLDGSASFDEDNDPLTYRWRFVFVPDRSTNAELSDKSAVKPSFVADMEGTYEVELIVSDGKANSKADTVTITVASANSAPTAHAGDDQSVKTGQRVEVDGRDSQDADGDLLTYQWSFVSVPDGSAAVLEDASSVVAAFTPDVDGEYRLSLVVNDGVVDSAPDEVVVTASTPNSKPVANPGGNQTVNVGDTVTLDGSSSHDADNDQITYQWHFVTRPAGSNAELSGDTTVSPSFTADVEGDYVVGLVVNDGQEDSDNANVTITAQEVDLPPVAVINASTTSAMVGEVVNLDADDSYDPEGRILRGTWTLASRPEGSNAEIDTKINTWREISIRTDVAGSYTIELIVTEGGQESEPARVVITATELNRKPTADAGEDQTVNIGDLVTLDGSNSIDPNDDVISYSWSFRSTPEGSSAELTDASSVAPSFAPDIAGDYIVQLVVNDGEYDSDPVTVKVTAVDPLVDGLKLESYSFGSWNDETLSYVSNGSMSKTETCVGSCPNYVTLEEYRITAIGGDYTLDNVEAVVITPGYDHLNPLIDGLYTGQTITKGSTVSFDLNVGRINVNQVKVRFSFDVVETGKRFESNITLTLKI